MKLFIYYLLISTFYCIEGFSQSLYDDFNRDNISKDDIIANVGKIGITAEEYFYSYEFGPSFPKKEPNSKVIHLNYMINEKLLALEGLSKAKLSDSAIENVYNDIVGDLATEELFKDEIVNLIKIDSNEIIKSIDEKLTDVELKWLFTHDKQESEKYFERLESGIPFDTLFITQINDSVYADQRSLKMSLFDLRKKNPELHKIFNSLEINGYSKPILVDGGWYIISLKNQTKTLIQSKSEYDQNYSKSIVGLTKIKMDSLSDLHVHNLMLINNPIIKREAFTILRTYIGKFILDSNTFDDWELLNKMEIALKKNGLSSNSNYNDLVLVETLKDNFTLENFIIWYRNRELHLKFQKANLVDFSKSLENMIWRMVRDKLLIKEAKEKKYYENSWVKKQSSWWKDKITYSVYKNELLNSINIKNNEINGEDNSVLRINEDLEIKYASKIFQALQSAKKNYPVTINYELLDKIKVSDEENNQAIELYTAKNGGLIPRPAYPSIDIEWATWQ